MDVTVKWMRIPILQTKPGTYGAKKGLRKGQQTGPEVDSALPAAQGHSQTTTPKTTTLRTE